MLRLLTVLVFTLGLLPAPAVAGPLKDAAVREAIRLASTQGPSQPSPQDLRIRAERRKSRGKRIMFWGGLVAGSGVAMTAAVATGRGQVASIMVLPGAGIFGWGLFEYLRGSQELDRLANQKP